MASLSCSFVADLPPLTETQLAKLHAWIQKGCTAGDVHLNKDGSMKLVCTRTKAVDKRQHQRTFRTNLLHWGADLATRQTDWLRLVDESDERASEQVETERNALESASEDMEIMAETLTTEPRNETHNTPDITPVTKPAFSRCTSAELKLPPNLLSAFSIAVR